MSSSPTRRRMHSVFSCLRLLVLSIVVISPPDSLMAQEQTDFPPRVDPTTLAEVVRTSEPLSAVEEKAQLFVPSGFRVDLVASEPDIAKPMNMAFDDRGRLWVSHSVEYPLAATEGQPHRDRISVIDDSDGDGIPDRVSTFAEDLNIPIGLYPWREGVICFSIPNILYIRDTDGDGRGDQREVLYGPFDTTRDTHGMCNAFRAGADGWIYACHGFNNQSTVAGRDGHTVTMKSGNVFRFRPDGSRIEHFTKGQVNPFGMAIDRYGDIFTADCHTKPVSLLLQGGYYDSFGRPHDGLGYVPAVMDHLHGSTAIGGIALGEALRFPEEYRDNSFGGNVMTSRVNRNRIVRQGGSVRAVEEEDFLISKDPWFRPVDLICGPDGALYIADFYNRIIGHYEVPLDHPGRDRTRGRIWRVSWHGDSTDTASGDAQSETPAMVAEMSVSMLVNELDNENSVISDLAFARLAKREPIEVGPIVRQAFKSSEHAETRWRSLRLLHLLNLIERPELQRAIHDQDACVRVHAFRVLAEAGASLADGDTAADQRDFIVPLLQTGFEDESALVRRVAVQAASHHPDRHLISSLLQLWHETDSADVHLRHCIRMALRDHLQRDEWFRSIENDLSADDVLLIGSVCPAVGSQVAASFVVRHLDRYVAETPATARDLIRFAARKVDDASLAELVQVIRTVHAGERDVQLELLESITSSSPAMSSNTPQIVTQWAETLCCELLDVDSPDRVDQLLVEGRFRWEYEPHSTAPNDQNCWTVSTRRRSTDGVNAAPLYSSFESGETRTGIYRSEPFALSESLSFYLAGHDGFPDQPPNGRNVVLLRSADDNRILRSASPPRHDVAHPVEWDLKDVQGMRARVELVDGDDAGAYAWLAVGRFSRAELNPDLSLRNHIRAAELIAVHQLTSFRPLLAAALRNPAVDPHRRAGFALAIGTLAGDVRQKALAVALQSMTLPPDLVESVCEILAADDASRADAALISAARVGSTSEQRQIVGALSETQAGAELAMQLLASGVVSLHVLLDPATQSRLAASVDATARTQLAAWVSQLPPEEDRLAAEIERARNIHRQRGGDVARGRQVFQRNCVICHQLAGEGKRIGPNLDGIGNRGLDRLTEDLFAPSRNVDVAFRASTLLMDDGRVLAGLVQDVNDASLQIIDNNGKATLVNSDSIEERTVSLLSPMPANLNQLLTEQQIGDLLAFLLSQTH